MPRLHGVLGVLEDDLDEVVERGGNDRGSNKCWAIRGLYLDGTLTENSRDVEVIRKLQRGVRVDVGHPVNRVTLLSVYPSRRVGQYDCLCYRYLSIMV